MLAELNQLGAKLETTEGTTNTPVVGDKKFLVRNLQYEAINPKVEREARSSVFSTRPHVGRAIGGKLSFEIDLYAGTQAALPVWATVLLAACRWGTVTGGTSAAWVINPVSVNNLTTCPPLTLSCNVDGYEHRLAGCRGNVKCKFRAGNTIAAEFEFLGVHVTPVDTAMLTPTFETNADDCAIFMGAAVALTGISPATDVLSAAEAVIEGMDIDFGNTLFLRPDANGAFGYRSCQIVGGMPKITIDPEWVSIATFDFITNMQKDYLFSITTGALPGQAAGNNIKFDCPRVQFGGVKRASRGGIAIAQNELVCRGNAGNDEVTLTLSA